MAARREAVSSGPEWRVNVPEGSSATVETDSSWGRRMWDRLVGSGWRWRSKVSGFGKKVWKLGADDPRKVIHGFKVGLALTLVSLFYYTRPLYRGFGSSAMWAVMTVVVVFEYTVGGCLYKGINRAIATLSAGGLAVGIHWIASKSGEKIEPFVLSASVFILASAATFSRFIPAVKARFDYGVTIFILTFSLVAVSGYRVDELVDLAVQRISTIAIGIAITISVCVLLCPVWSGLELHLLISRNMAKLADSLECCVEEQLENKDDTAAATDEKEAASSDGKSSERYKCVLNSKAAEESHANLARWEPAHGRFAFRHPWKQYLKVGASVRYCAYCVEALHGCINSEMKVSELLKKHMSDACMKLSSDSSKVLKELSRSVDLMKRSPSIDLLVREMSNSVQELHNALALLPAGQITQTTTPTKTDESCNDYDEMKKSSSGTGALLLMEAMPLMSLASLLIEISARIEGVVKAVETLASAANFKPVGKEKSSAKVRDEEQEVRALEQV